IRRRGGLAPLCQRRHHGPRGAQAHLRGLGDGEGLARSTPLGVAWKALTESSRTFESLDSRDYPSLSRANTGVRRDYPRFSPANTGVSRDYPASRPPEAKTYLLNARARITRPGPPLAGRRPGPPDPTVSGMPP